MCGGRIDGGLISVQDRPEKDCGCGRDAVVSAQGV